MGKALGKEIEVFEKAEHTEIYSKANVEQIFSTYAGTAFFDPSGYRKIDQRTCRHQKQKSPVPPAVEYVTGGEQKHILPIPFFPQNKPIDDEDDRKENGKFDGVKKHDLPCREIQSEPHPTL